MPLRANLGLPGYVHCGRGRSSLPGINRLDEHCRAHDWRYAVAATDVQRHEADRRLRFDALSEPGIAAFVVAAAMTVKMMARSVGVDL